AMDGHGLPAPLVALLGPLGEKTSQRVTLGARRLPSVWGEGRPFPARDVTLAAFHASHANPIAARDAWRGRLGSTIATQEFDVRELVCLRADNRELRATPELRARIRELLERTRAGVVFAPSFTDIHPDHQTVLRLLAESMREMSGPRPDVALYEVWSLVAPSH